jgi:hypothetical protein
MRRNYPISFFAIVCYGTVVFLNDGCNRRQTPPTAAYPFEFTNVIEEGLPVPYITLTNGISIRFDETNIMVSFGSNAILSADYNPDTLELKSMFMRTAGYSNNPGRSTMFNTEGLPYIRNIADLTNSVELFYRGEWYKRIRESGRSYIMIGARKQWMHYNGSRWVEVLTNSNADVSN